MENLRTTNTKLKYGYRYVALFHKSDAEQLYIILFCYIVRRFPIGTDTNEREP